jgi:hypothetical protein
MWRSTAEKANSGAIVTRWPLEEKRRIDATREPPRSERFTTPTRLAARSVRVTALRARKIAIYSEIPSSLF